MSIRRTFLLLIAPLFLLLAGVNGALLYVWERAEAERGLQNQAIAAAVTTAAFADASEDLSRALSDPTRAAAMAEAVERVEDLLSLYLVTPDGRIQRLAGAPSDFWPGRFEAPRAPTSAAIRADPAGKRRATALAPVKGGGFVIAQLDAEPLFAQVAGLQRLVIGLVAAAGVLGLVMSLLISRVIVRELARNDATITAIRAGTPDPDIRGFAIRETQDLALAVRLMRTSVTGRLARGRRELARRDRARDEAVSVAAYREIVFPARVTEAAGAVVAMRMLGDAPAGAFHVLSLCEGAAVGVGVCEGESPSAALAAALAAQRFLEARLCADGEAPVERARAAFGVTRFVWRPVEAGAAWALPLLDGNNDARAEAYAARADGLAPDAIIDDIAALLRPDGVLLVVKASA